MRNAADLGAFARDLAAGRLPSRRPPRRVLVRLRPARWQRLDGTRVEAVAGAWPGRVTAPDAAPPLEGDRDAAVGWETEGGPLVLPARAQRDAAVACIPAVAAQLAGLAAEEPTAACVVVDAYNRPGPAAKNGTLLRGTARLRYDGALARVELEVSRETTWDGAEARTEERPAS
jgi:hypothetical protein